MISRILCMLALSGLSLSFVDADQYVFRQVSDGQLVGPKRIVDGEVVVQANDGGVLLQGDDGRLWLIQPNQILHSESSPTPAPIDLDAMNERMADELPDDFRSFQTAHYLLFYQGSDVYARQCATLFESLYRSFFAYFRNQGVKLNEPEFPLVAMVLRDRSEFVRYAESEIGQTAQSVIGYYHLESNRMTTYRVPNLERNVATIIHEATHQLAYNCGLQTRLADNPMWVSEGLALFFESPDLSNPTRWRGVGRVNQVNLARWRRYERRRPQDSIVTLLADDSRFRSSSTAESAYGESWALTYFLLRTQRKSFIRYLQALSDQTPLGDVTPRERIAMFEAAMGMDLEELDKKFVANMRRVR